MLKMELTGRGLLVKTEARLSYRLVVKSTTMNCLLSMMLFPIDRSMLPFKICEQHHHLYLAGGGFFYRKSQRKKQTNKPDILW